MAEPADRPSRSAPSGARPPWYAAGWVVPACIVLACLLVAPCLSVGLAADDFVHAARLDPDSNVAGFPHAPNDLFVFASGDAADRRAAIDAGTLSWWMPEGYQLAFWRPITTWTHRFDHALNLTPELRYAHNIVWFGLLLAALAVLYRRFGTPAAAGLALILYALDDAHGPTVGFIANRNALVAAVFAVLALIAHDRWRRDEWRAGAVLAPLALAASLLSAEAGVAGAAFLVAYALAFDLGTVRERALSLVPTVLVAGTWFVAYGALGYGARLSGVYIDPGGEPVRFGLALVERLPVLALGQFGAPWSDFWLLVPPSAQVVLWTTAVGLLCVGTWLAWPLLVARRDLRFWALGSTLAAVPVCATFPSDRLLIFIGFGAAPIVGALVQSAWTARSDGSRARALAAKPVAVCLIAVHLVLAPLLLPLRAQSMRTAQRTLEFIGDAVPTDASVVDDHLIIVTAPSDGLVSYFPMLRDASRTPRPATMRLLASSPGATVVTRIDAQTLDVALEMGLLASQGESMLRDPNLGFEEGFIQRLPDVTIEVLETLPDGRASTLRARFGEPLNSPRYRWLTWSGDGFVPFVPPPVGESVTIPAVDFAALFERAIAPE